MLLRLSIAMIRSLIPKKNADDSWSNALQERKAALLGNVKWLFFMTGLLFAFLLLQSYIVIGWNSSDSLDGHLYISKKYRNFKPKYDVRVRFFYHGKFVPANTEVPFRKKIVGLPGDEIQIDAQRQVFVNRKNGQRVLIGAAKPFSKTGVPLAIVSAGVIPTGYVAVAGDHKDSFDSRYQDVGLIDVTEISDEAIVWF